MFRQHEFCPKCQGIQNTSVSIGLRKTVRPDGSEAEVLMIHLHCSSCNTYIRSYVMGEERKPRKERRSTVLLPQK